MITLPASVRVFVATMPTDLRKSFDGLSAAVEHALASNPLSGHLYVFFNKRRTQVRCLFWDRTGYCIVAKKLSRGRFSFTEQLQTEASSVELEAAELGLILEGIELKGALRRPRWRPPQPTA
jgi:transposase